jgi:hypothetical protein
LIVIDNFKNFDKRRGEFNRHDRIFEESVRSVF